MKICARCVLPETFPGIVFDAAGVCNFCREPDRDRLAGKKSEYRERFQRLVEEQAGKGEYDVLLCWSGGKDSTFTLLTLKRDFGLKVLAYTLDNGFLSGRALENIRTVTERLGIDHLMFRPRPDVLRTVFGGCARRNVFPLKTLERASAVCTACMSITRFTALRTAVDRGIPFLAYGWSPGQAPVTSSIMKNNPAMAGLMQRSVLDPLRELAGDAVNPYFLGPEHLREGTPMPYNIHPLAFLDYDEGAILDAIGALGWRPPGDTDANSTNCLLNAFAIDAHLRQFGFHPYALELSGLVRQGHLDREEALARLGKNGDPAAVAEMRRRLGLED